MWGNEEKTGDGSHLVLFGILEELADVVAGQNASLGSEVRGSEGGGYVVVHTGRMSRIPMVEV